MSASTTNATKARKKLLHFIEEIEEARVINLYEFLKAEIEEEHADLIYSDKFTEELDEDYKDYQNGGAVYTQQEVDKRTDELLKSLRKK
ncbi:MAG: hypothetical protein ABI136_07540 [Ginsengibacter sp.]